MGVQVTWTEAGDSGRVVFHDDLAPGDAAIAADNFARFDLGRRAGVDPDSIEIEDYKEKGHGN
jgi:hypothetical protein